MDNYNYFNHACSQHAMFNNHDSLYRETKSTAGKTKSGVCICVWAWINDLKTENVSKKVPQNGNSR